MKLHNSSGQAKDKPVVYPAQLYDHYTASFTTEYDNILFERIQGLCGKSGHGNRVLLDIGTGTGQLLIKLALKMRDPSLKFYGTDYFEDMVAVAASNVARAQLTSRITILKGDVHAMTFPDAFSNIIISRSTIHHWRDPEKAFQEIYRVLNSSGVAILHDLRRDAPQDLKRAFQSKRDKAGVPPGNFEEKFTPDEVKTMLGRALPDIDCTITAPTEGLGALGFEVCIRKRGITGDNPADGK